MSAMERIYRIDQLLAGRKAVPRAELQEKLGVSWATLKRDLAYMKDRLHAPIVFDRDLGGYRFEREGQRIGPQYELPGLWFSAEEIHALLTMQHLLANLDTGGLLGPHIQPLLARLSGLLGSADNPAEEVKKRIRIETVGARRFHLSHFQAVGSALLRRKRMLIRYHARGTDQETEREISPQRLIYYRDNWYLDAWCHERQALRTFSADVIEEAELLERAARDIPEAKLDRHLGAGFGIFSGARTELAVLQFAPARARWVARETWHPEQQGQLQLDGSYLLKVPFSDPRELVMDVLKYGPDVEVLAPASLAALVVGRLADARAVYDARSRDA